MKIFTIFCANADIVLYTSRDYMYMVFGVYLNSNTCNIYVPQTKFGNKLFYNCFTNCFTIFLIFYFLHSTFLSASVLINYFLEHACMWVCVMRMNQVFWINQIKLSLFLIFLIQNWNIDTYQYCLLHDNVKLARNHEHACGLSSDWLKQILL